MISKRVVLLFLFCFLALFKSLATDAKFEYSDAGRLQRIVTTNDVVFFHYDSFGNLVSTSKTETIVDDFDVADILPKQLRQGQKQVVVLKGTGLGNVILESALDKLVISDVTYSANQIMFKAKALAELPLGKADIYISNKSKTKIVSLKILPDFPDIVVSPLPIALPNDSRTRSFEVGLSHKDAVDREITVTIEDSSIAHIATKTVAIPAGEKSVDLKISSRKEGITYLVLSEAELGQVKYPIFVTNQAEGINVTYGESVGVERTSNSENASIESFLNSPTVGILKAQGIDYVSPHYISIGDQSTIQVKGIGLSAVKQVTLSDMSDISISNLNIISDEALEFNINVTDGADLGVRKLEVSTVSDSLPFAQERDSLLTISPKSPVVNIVSPNFLVKGKTKELVIYGENLSLVNQIKLIGADASITYAIKGISDNGTKMRLDISVPLDVDPGKHALQVISPAAASSEVMTLSNQISIVSEVKQVYTPILSPSVEVVRFADKLPSTADTTLSSEGIGVVLGQVAIDKSPDFVNRGDNAQIIINGIGLDKVTDIVITPSGSISVSNITSNSTGTALTVDIAITADADLQAYRLVLQTVDDVIPFVRNNEALLNVIESRSHVPEVLSLSENLISKGRKRVPLKILGKNFQNFTQIEIIPSVKGIEIGEYQIDAKNQVIDLFMSVGDTVPSGDYHVIVHTLGGHSSLQSSIHNTFSVVGNTISYSPVLSPGVGVLVGEDSQEETVDSSLLSPQVQVLKGDGATETIRLDTMMKTPIIQIVKELYVSSVETAAELLGGEEAVIQIHGYGFSDITDIAIQPSGSGIEIINKTIDNEKISLSLAIANDVTDGVKRIILTTQGETVVFANPEERLIYTLKQEPKIHSISPILGKQGDSIVMTIRGERLQSINAVSVLPSTGITFGKIQKINAEGTALTIGLTISEVASLGSRVIRLHSRANTVSGTTPTAANTFTIYEK